MWEKNVRLNKNNKLRIVLKLNLYRESMLKSTTHTGPTERNYWRKLLRNSNNLKWSINDRYQQKISLCSE